MGKFKVGDRVRYKGPKTAGIPFGFEFVVNSFDRDGFIEFVDANGDARFRSPDEFSLASPPSPEITLRDQFAMAALTAATVIVGEMRSGDVEAIGYEAAIAGAAYSIADAILAKRERAK